MKQTRSALLMQAAVSHVVSCVDNWWVQAARSFIQRPDRFLIRHRGSLPFFSQARQVYGPLPLQAATRLCLPRCLNLHAVSMQFACLLTAGVCRLL